MRRTLAVMAMVALALTGCGGKTSNHTITGTMTLTDSSGFDYDLPADDSNGDDGGRCWGTDGYDDIDEGAAVIVKSDDETVGKGELRQGVRADDECTFSFTVSDVPSRKFYSVEVSHRGALTYSQAEMDKHHWTVSFTLG